MHVAMAHAGGYGPHQHLVRTGGTDVNLLDAEWLKDFP
jgi:hypothetical protein